MRLLEYQGKELFSKYGIPVLRSKLAKDPAEAVSAVRELGLPAVVKAQVLSGGRGKAGGVSVVRSLAEAESEAARILALKIGGDKTRALLVEEALDHKEEDYLSVSLDRGRREFVALASREGGVEVEAKPGVAMLDDPVPLSGLSEPAASRVAARLGLEGSAASQFASILRRLELMVRQEDCELAEINPLATGRDGTLVALDSKVVLDDNALFRHKEFSKLPPEDPLEGEAASEGFVFVRLDGDIAVMGNGAGLVLSTLDLVADAGGRAACFLDLGGGAQRARVETALRLVSSLSPRAVLVNIFAGITETTDIATGFKEVLEGGRFPPIFARIRGPQEEDARSILSGAGVAVFVDSLDAVGAAVGGQRR